MARAASRLSHLSGRRAPKQGLSPVPSGPGDAKSYILFRPELCKHHSNLPHEERTNEKSAYHWPGARRRVRREPGERRRTHGDIEEHQGNRRDHPRFSQLLDPVLLSGRQPEAGRLCDGHLLQDRRRREEGAQARQARGQAQSGHLGDPHSADGQRHHRPRMRLDHQQRRAPEAGLRSPTPIS